MNEEKEKECKKREKKGDITRAELIKPSITNADVLLVPDTHRNTHSLPEEFAVSTDMVVTYTEAKADSAR